MTEDYKEPNMLKEASLTILDAVSDFIEDFKTDLLQQDNDLLEPVFYLLVSLLKRQQSVPFLASFFKGRIFFRVSEDTKISIGIQVLIADFKKLFFVYKNPTYCGDLLYELLKYA